MSEQEEAIRVSKLDSVEIISKDAKGNEHEITLYKEPGVGWVNRHGRVISYNEYVLPRGAKLRDE